MLRKGVTFSELIIVFGMILILMAFISLRVTPTQRRTSLSEIEATLASDIRQQQLKSMNGTSPSGSGSPFGIYFNADNYVLFRGAAYNPSDVENYVVDLDPGFSFTTVGFPGSVVVFARGSGEISGFMSDSYDLTLSDEQEGTSRIITVNRYGAITQIN